MTKTTLLDGKWEFINQEIYLPQTNKWIPQKDFVRGLIWQFRLGCAFGNHEQGIIVESAPEVEPTEMEYIYNPATQRLIVDIEIQDSYKLTPLEETTIHLSTITDKTNGVFLRYTLKK